MCGTINLIESLVVKCVDKAINNTTNFLLSRTKPTQILKDVFISAMTNEGLNKDNVNGRVVEKYLYIPTVVDILPVFVKSRWQILDSRRPLHCGSQEYIVGFRSQS